MLIEERRKEIVKYVETHGKATVEELSRAVYASAPTVRRDITAMARSGLLKKVYGGVMPPTAADREIPMSSRESSATDAKKLMAKRAAALVHDGDVVILDGSSSAKALVPYLAEFSELIVITSGAKTAVALADAGIRCFCTGGKMITRSFSYVGPHAEEFVRSINADILFFSCHGYDDGIATDLSADEVALRRVMMSRTSKKVLLCDKSKYGRRYIYNLCTADDVDEVISE